MRNLLLSLVFAITFTSGVLITNVATLGYEWLYPGFDKAEATALIGQQIICSHKTEHESLVRSPQNGFCENVNVGERGTVIDIKEVSTGNYFLVVRWHDASQDYLTYLGRRSYREFVKEF